MYLSSSLYHYYSDASFLARCATRDRRLCTSSLDLHARVLGFFPRFSFSVFHPQIWPSPLHLYTYRLARDELENYARSRRIFFFLGESPVDRPRRLEIVGDSRTMSIVPAIVQGPFTSRIRFVRCRKISEKETAWKKTKLAFDLTKLVQTNIKLNEQITLIIYWIIDYELVDSMITIQ